MSLARQTFPTLALFALETVSGTLRNAARADTLERAIELIQQAEREIHSLIQSAGDAITAARE